MDCQVLCRAIFQDLKDAYAIKFSELQEIMSWPQFLGQVELQCDAVKITKVHWVSAQSG